MKSKTHQNSKTNPNKSSTGSKVSRNLWARAVKFKNPISRSAVDGRGVEVYDQKNPNWPSWRCNRCNDETKSTIKKMCDFSFKSGTEIGEQIFIFSVQIFSPHTTCHLVVGGVFVKCQHKSWIPWQSAMILSSASTITTCRQLMRHFFQLHYFYCFQIWF